MPEHIPARADLRQLRTRAKELLRTLPIIEGSPKPKLADAQRQIAREHGFSNWPALISGLETPRLIEELRSSIETGDVDRLQRLLEKNRTARRLLDRPLFTFDSPALIEASRHPNAERLLPVLVGFGADPNVRSTWWAGGFGALDGASEEIARLLLDLGARFDVWSAAAHGRAEVLNELLDCDPTLVDAPGGDGGRPLHFASTPEVVDLLIARGADLEARDVDHESTPVQYHVNRPDILRALVDHGARPDLFTAVALDDRELARTILATTPGAMDTRVGDPPFATSRSNGGHIYVYRIGGGTTPFHFAVERGSRAVLPELLRRASPPQRLVASAWAGDREAVTEILRERPDIGLQMGANARAIADAAGAGRVETVRLLLESGVDPRSGGMDTGSALHTACWFGHLAIVRLLAERVPLDLRDEVHGSPPLGWAIHGARWCRNPQGDYVAVVETLLAAGADPRASANEVGTSMLEQAGDREDVREILRAHGAV